MSETLRVDVLYEVTRSLANNLSASEAFTRYEQARHDLEADAEANTLLRRLSELQASLRQAQMRNEVTESDIDELRTLQRQAQDNAIIATYAQAQQSAVELLRGVNQEISQLLGVDFAGLARRTTC